MPDVIVAQVIFENVTRFPEDRTQNTWHFISLANPATVADATEVAQQLVSFYNDTPAPEAFPVAFFLSPHIDRPLSKVKCYRLSDAVPRSPFFESGFTLGPTTNPEGFPNEVAVCLSYKADNVSGINPRRTRGRIYLGPHAETSEFLEGDARPIAQERRIIAAAAARLASDPSPLVDWAVYSRAQVTSGGQRAFAVTNGYVDNAFDTQRRRGRDATTRTLWP